jgi:hypothetical protein
MAEYILDTTDGIFNARTTGEIVRCRDCKSERSNPLVGCGHICEYFGFPLPDFDGYCAWGEKRDGDER